MVLRLPEIVTAAGMTLARVSDGRVPNERG